MRLVRVLIALAAAAIPTAAAAQQLEPVRWSVRAAPHGITAGQLARIQIEAQIDEGWHLYALEQAEKGPLPTELTAGAAPTFTLRKTDIEVPEPERTLDRNFGVETAWYADSAVFTLPVKVAANAAAGAQVIDVRARFQACNDTLCLRPATVTLPVKVTVIKRRR
jgi:DsbC/DsbD-like thiol-disulfide interchange protein